MYKLTHIHTGMYVCMYVCPHGARIPIGLCWMSELKSGAKAPRIAILETSFGLWGLKGL